MQTALETAPRRWELIRPVPSQAPRPLEAAEIEQWLSVDVSQVVRQLLYRADFRDLACASIKRLCQGPDTEEGRLIERIDHALVTTARNLASCLQRPAIRQALESTPATRTRQPISERSNSADTISGNSSPPVPDAPSEGNETSVRQILESDLAMLNSIANRPWRSLTSGTDYFCSNAMLNLTDDEIEKLALTSDGDIPSQGEFVPLFQPRLQLPDDFVWICFELRVEHWVAELSRIYNRIINSVNACSNVPEEDRKKLRAARCPVNGHLDELRRLWREAPQAEARRAAVQLVQIYAAFHPESDFDWITDDASQVLTASYFCHRLGSDFRDSESHRRLRRGIAETIARALSEISEMYHRMEDVELQIQQHVQTHRLCLIEGRQRREVYWDGNLLTPKNWEKIAEKKREEKEKKERLLANHWYRRDRAWILLSSLTEKALTTGQGVESSTIRISIRDAFNDLGGLLPASLFELIVGTLKTGYRLNLCRDEIYYGFFKENEVLESLLNQSGTPFECLR